MNQCGDCLSENPPKVEITKLQKGGLDATSSEKRKINKAVSHGVADKEKRVQIASLAQTNFLYARQK